MCEGPFVLAAVLHGRPPGERRRLSPRTPSPPGTEAGPRTPGFRGFPWLSSVFALIPGSRWQRGAAERGLHAGIRERSPDARVVTTAYLPLVPADGGCDFVSRMSPGDITWTRAVTERSSWLGSSPHCLRV